jgi:iron complex outermembrane receptor protein
MPEVRPVASPASDALSAAIHALLVSGLLLTTAPIAAAGSAADTQAPEAATAGPEDRDPTLPDAAGSDASKLPPVQVEAVAKPFDANTPNTIVTLERETIAVRNNAFNAHDVLKYLPSLAVRNRYLGDRSSNFATRSAGANVSARSLVYVDGLPLSNLLGNSADFAPRWGMVSPDEIERVGVAYGPFSAEYPGNSAGVVVKIETRMPERFEASAKGVLSHQDFELYGSDTTHTSNLLELSVGNRHDRLSWLLNYARSDISGTPQGFANRPLSTTPATSSDIVVRGAVFDIGPNGAPRVIFGSSSGLHEKVMESARLKFRYELSPTLSLTYHAGLFLDDDLTGVETYLRGPTGEPVFSGNVNVNGFRYTLPASLFRNNKFDMKHLMQGLSLVGGDGGDWQWQVNASDYDYRKDRRGRPGTAFPGAALGGVGTVVDDNSGWGTLDAKVNWQPADGRHRLSFGVQHARYELDAETLNTADWLRAPGTTRIDAFTGKTTTHALFAQDAITLRPGLQLTLGARYERWRAEDGSLSNATRTVRFPQREDDSFSPKGTLSYAVNEDWTLRGSVARAYRFPTVSELFQGGFNSANVLINNDPNLKGEAIDAQELSVERVLGNGLLRASLFRDVVDDALFSQLNVSTLVTNIQNIDRVRTRGVELAFDVVDIGLPGLDVAGSVTYADSTIVVNANNPASVGKRQPGVPDWRAAVQATWRSSDRLSFTLGARYSGKQFATLENREVRRDVWGASSNYFIVDARMKYQMTPQVSLALGIDNLTDGDFYTAATNPHIFPPRNVLGEVKVRF